MNTWTSPRTARLATIGAQARAGIPTGVTVAPMILGQTDREIPSIVIAAAGAGASFAGYVTLRLPYAIAPLFEEWLTRHLPEKKDKVLNRIRPVFSLQ